MSEIESFSLKEVFDVGIEPPNAIYQFELRRYGVGNEPARGFFPLSPKGEEWMRSHNILTAERGSLDRNWYPKSEAQKIADEMIHAGLIVGYKQAIICAADCPDYFFPSSGHVGN